jgi:hypothetical protein
LVLKLTVGGAAAGIMDQPEWCNVDKYEDSVY